ncbi:glycine cleavage system protein R [Neptunicella marina]|uniref:Glycine cleavage system transcriptional repressor n=1 Tax=Neptunicella marina TaxID=2125989 RepID=A0A8J6IVJ1_9ALTE|nr:ACT domain-containing protein [Neptunicella marina]MBC3767476.1 glycine cleavage system transcriptional repressor [Neptunicella marina]
MKQQLIVTILGTDQVGILSALSNTMSESGCNILDSRQAIYGHDLCLTMIIEGEHAAITRAELNLPAVCQKFDLLSIMKRTREHHRQDLTRLANVEFVGLDAIGIIHKVTNFFVSHNIAVSAFRQHTFTEKSTQAKMLKVKMVISLPDTADAEAIVKWFSAYLDELELIGTITLH